MVFLQTRLNQVLPRTNVSSSPSHESFHHGCCRKKPLFACIHLRNKSSTGERRLRSGNCSRMLRVHATNSVVAPPSAWPAEKFERSVCRDLPDIITLSDTIQGFSSSAESSNISKRESNASTGTRFLANKGAEADVLLEFRAKKEVAEQDKQVEHPASPFSLENDAHSDIPKDEICIVEAERLRRKRISEANKNQVPWNKGKGKGKGKSKNYKQDMQSNGAATSSHTKSKVIESDMELLNKEKLRRQRLGAAIAGKAAWNKGKELSEEARQWIKERTLEAMKNPKVREKLRARPSTMLSNETKAKIKSAMLRSWQERKKLKSVQETLVEEWKEYVADNARRGLDGDIKHNWNSYDTIARELQHAWRLKNKRNKAKLGTSSACRSKIPNPIKAKVTESVENDQGFKCGRDRPIKTGAKISRSVRKGLPPYRNPSNSEMLERLKQIRVRRWLKECPQRSAYKETSPTRAVEKARLLMEKAQRAARVLEAQLATDKGALPSLQDAQQLLSEAEESLKAVVSKPDICMDRSEHDCSVAY